MPATTSSADTYSRIYDAVARVPEGTVVTYGQIAEMVGVGPREVGRALRLLPRGRVCPWHRVVNAKGEVSLRSGSDSAHTKQERLLEREGIEFRSGRIDLDVFRWHPFDGV